MAKLIVRQGVYYSDLRIGKKRIRRALSTDKRIAENKLADLIQERQAMRHGHAPENASWATFRDKFLDEQKTKARPTYDIYRHAVERLEAFRQIHYLREITPALLNDLMTDWRKPKWRKRGKKFKNKKFPIGLYMRNRMLRALKTMMTRAESYTLVKPQKWASVAYDREPKGRLLWYTADELRGLLAGSSGVWKTIVLLGARAGLRRAEMYHLEWSDVDFARNRIHIAPKAGWNPKDYERRWIPMTADLRAHLEALPKGQYVVEEDGQRPTIGAMSVLFARLLKKANLKGSIHILRHTFGAHLASAGVSIYKIQELMGHSDSETTAIYAHLAPESIEDAVSRLPTL